MRGLQTKAERTAARRSTLALLKAIRKYFDDRADYSNAETSGNVTRMAEMVATERDMLVDLS